MKENIIYFNFGKVFEWWSDDSWCNFMFSDVNLHTKQNIFNATKLVRMCQKRPQHILCQSLLINSSIPQWTHCGQGSRHHGRAAVAELPFGRSPWKPEDPLCASDIGRKWWCIHHGLKIHGWGQPQKTYKMANRKKYNLGERESYSKL